MDLTQDVCVCYISSCLLSQQLGIWGEFPMLDADIPEYIAQTISGHTSAFSHSHQSGLVEWRCIT